jgi:glucokinase
MQALAMSILVGDIGGTHCRLAMAQVAGGRVILEHIQRYQNAEYDSLGAILTNYLVAHASPSSTCLAVAGPTDGRSVHFTNLDWRIDANALERELGLEQVHLVNDFSAVGWGLNALGTDDLHPLQAGQPDAQGVKAAVGAGTGLGVSIGIWRNGLHLPLPTEGGHMGFAPLDTEQDRLLCFMRDLYGRVSVERLISGPGIVDLYRFCAQETRVDSTPLLANPIPAQAISQAGMRGDNGAATRAMLLFARIYGQVAGDVALLTRAQGGIYLAGGIAPQILPLLAGPEFLAGFHAKGRFSDWTRSVPVAVILDPDIGLRGAALAANTP